MGRAVFSPSLVLRNNVGRIMAHTSTDAIFFFFPVLLPAGGPHRGVRDFVMQNSPRLFPPLLLYSAAGRGGDTDDIRGYLRVFFCG